MPGPCGPGPGPGCGTRLPPALSAPVGLRWAAEQVGVAACRVLVLLGEMERRNAAATTFYCVVLWVQVFRSGFPYCLGTE